MLESLKEEEKKKERQKKNFIIFNPPEPEDEVTENEDKSVSMDIFINEIGIQDVEMDEVIRGGKEAERIPNKTKPTTATCQGKVGDYKKS